MYQENSLITGSLQNFPIDSYQNANQNPQQNQNFNQYSNPNPTPNPKIKLISNSKLENLQVTNYKQKLQQQQEQMHQPEYTTANQYNFYLTKKQYELLKQGQEVNETSLYEWFFKTISDEFYKLSFYDVKFPRIKMFWPSQYQDRLKPHGDVQFYFKQFEGVQIDDYFDLIFFTKLENGVLQQEIFININMLEERQKINTHQYENLSSFHFTNEKCYFRTYLDICTFINEFAKKYLSYQLNIEPGQLRDRFQAIATEKTRLILYELYDKKG
ncbi:hypothetical protein pb186bvf_010735 [Paramecium bursaria]